MAVMKMFVLKCKLAPLPGAGAEALVGGFGLVWVWTDCADRMENPAEQFLLRAGWMIDARDGIEEVSLETAAKDPILHAHYVSARNHGVSAELLCFEQPGGRLGESDPALDEFLILTCSVPPPQHLPTGRTVLPALRPLRSLV